MRAGRGAADECRLSADKRFLNGNIRGDQGLRPDQRGLSLLEYLALLIVLVGVVIWLYPRWVADQQAGYREMAQTALYGLAEALQAHHERTGTYGGAAGAQGEPADTGAPWMFPD